MKTEELIVALAGAAGPVGRLRSPAVRLVQWLGLAFGASICAGLVFGWRADLAAAVVQPRFLVLAGTAVAAAIFGSAAAFVLSVPGAERSRVQRWLPGLAVVGWIGTSATALAMGSPEPAVHVAERALHGACGLFVMTTAVVPALTLVLMLCRAAPVEPFWTSALAATAASSTALAAVQFLCPVDDPLHAFGSHFAPALAFFVVAAVAGRGRMARWQAVRRS